MIKKSGKLLKEVLKTMIEILDIDIDHQQLLNEFYKLNVDKLLKESPAKQISVQCDKKSPIEMQLSESCHSLWIDMSDIYNPKLRENNFVEIDFLKHYNNETNIITFNHNFDHKEPILFGKSYKGQNSIFGLDFEKTYFVNVISKNEFQLSLNRELTNFALPVFNRKDDLTFRLFRKVSEHRFDTISNYFKSTYIEETMNKIQEKYSVYRTRFMLSEPKTNLTWHRDVSKRIHIPIYTNENCFMVIENSVVKLPAGNTYLVDTTKYHTAINASNSSRVHLVACLG
jgi:hypothetical protein